MDEKFRRIKTGVEGKKLGKEDKVFAIIYTKKSQPYLNYEEIPEKDRPMNIPIVLIQARWDGKFGFCGGNVDKEDKTLKEAILREMNEEINYEADESNLIPFVTFANNRMHIHSFLYEVDEEKIIEIFIKSHKAKHFRAENCGSIMMQLHEKSIPNLIKQCWSGTAEKELELFITDILGLQIKK